MPNFTDLTGLAGMASAATAAVLLVPGTARMSKARLAILMATIFALMLVPFDGMPLAAYMRGASGDLSITTQVLLWSVLLRPWCGAASHNNRFALLILIVLFALMLYPMALGAGAYDPYRLGYGNPQFIAALMLFAFVAWFLKYTLIALCIALAILAWALGWYESGNLWDYLLDPFLSTYALAVITICGIKTWLKPGRGKNQHGSIYP